MPTYRLDIAYDGSGFRGYAANAGVRTVQGSLEDALATILRHPVETAVAGRTDAGVHARGQVVSFVLPESADLPRLQRALNRLLAPEVVVRSLAEAPEGFDARRSALWRSYRYAVDDCPVPDPARRWTVWHVAGPLDAAAMDRAARAFVGEHDFASLCRAVEGGSTVRLVLEAAWQAADGGLLVLAVSARAFCHQMVRSMVALCVEVGRGRLDAAAIPGILESGDRNRARGVAPPHGLTLWEVGYPPLLSAPGGGFPQPSLVGEWLVEATVPGGGAYRGTIAVRSAAETVELEWDTTAGRYFGIGLEEQGAWYVACGEDRDGLGLAVIDRRGEMRWSPALGRGTVGAARLARVAAPSGELRWEAGSVAAGLPFTGLALEGAGEVRWAALAGGPAARGLALPTADGWAVAWYPRFDQTVILRYLPGREPGTWVALWALGGRPDPAVELLRPAR